MPTATPLMMVTVGMYRRSTFSMMRGSRRNPGICMPEPWICCATDSGPMFAVSTQKMAKMVEPTIMTAA